MTRARFSVADQRLPLISLFAGGLAIGGSPIFVRLSEVDPMATAFWRTALSLLPFLLFALYRQREALALPRNLADLSRLAFPGLFLAADLAFWHLSIEMTSVANATLLVNLSPVFVTLASWLFFGAVITRRFLLGLGIAILGVVILKSGGVNGFGGGHWLGDTFAILGAIFYAGYMLTLGAARNRFTTLQVMIWNSAVAALAILPVALMTEDAIVPQTVRGWAIVTGLSMVSHVGGQAAIIYALAFLPTAFSSLTLLLQPVVAAILGVVLLNEPLGWNGIIGGAGVLAGILIARKAV